MKVSAIFLTLLSAYFFSHQSIAKPYYLWWEAEDYTSGNFPKSGEFDPKTPEQTQKLSGGQWINTGAKNRPIYSARYTLQLDQNKKNHDKSYYFYARKFWYHGPFRYRFNQGEWFTINKDNHPQLKDSVDLREFVVANWVELGQHSLKSGKNTLEIELTSQQGGAAFDSFVLSEKPFIPLGLRRPGEKLNLANQGFWSFEPDMDHFNNNALWDLRSLNENVAGEHGYIKLSADKNSFVLANNQPVRFWSINTTAQNSNNLNEIDRHARHLAKRGFNMVRFHGFIESKNEHIQTADQQQIDYSWRLVSSMKKQGIYTTLSPYWATHAKPQTTWSPVISGKNKNLSGLLFFEPSLQKAYKAWLKQWLTTVNPHTGIPLSKDPAVAIIQIQNEDSLLFWSFNEIQGPALRLLEKKFGTWAKNKYGNLSAAQKNWTSFSVKTDDFAKGYVGMNPLHSLTKESKNNHKHTRLNDQYQFLVETMRTWNQDVEKFLREEIGYQGLINAGNWRTANNVTMLDGERWSYGSNQVMAVNKYYTGGVHINPSKQYLAGYRIQQGDYFQNQSALMHPRKLPFNIKQVNGYPMIISESTWVSPMDYQSEAPFLVAAYSSLNGIDSYYWFSTGAESFANSTSKFNAARPSLMATYPAAALLFRQRYVQQAEPVIAEHRPMSDIWQRKTPLISEEPGFDPNRDKGLFHFLSSNEDTVDPLAFLVGPVVSHYNSDAKNTRVTPIDSFIHPQQGRIESRTKELVFDYRQGLSTINTPKAQGATGFLSRVSPLTLNSMTIHSNSHYATVIAVTLDDQTLEDSEKLLLQTTTRSRPYNFSAKATTFSNPHNKKDQRRYEGYRIDNMGTIPINMEEHHIDITLKNTVVDEAIMTDVNGYAVASVPLQKTDHGVRLTIPKHAIYVVLHKRTSH